MNKLAMMGMLASVYAWAGDVFGGKDKSTLKTATDPHKTKTRSVGHGRRTFEYLGVDGNRHTVRIGKPFPSRPHRFPAMVLATRENRLQIEVK